MILKLEELLFLKKFNKKIIKFFFFLHLSEISLYFYQFYFKN